LVHPTEGELYQVGTNVIASGMKDLLAWGQREKQVFVCG